VGDMRVTVDIYDEDVWEEETAVAHTPLQVRGWEGGGCVVLVAWHDVDVVRRWREADARSWSGGCECGWTGRRRGVLGRAAWCGRCVGWCVGRAWRRRQL